MIERGGAGSSPRVEYELDELVESKVSRDPIAQFTNWFKQAQARVSPDPNAMSLATVGANGKPSQRIVLLKDYTPAGFVFFTNYESRKGKELSKNKNASLLFYWRELERQIRIEGRVMQINPKDSDFYFSSRPRGAKIAALISRQSQQVKNRRELEEAYAKLESALFGKEIERPEHWGGYVLVPKLFEFWQGRVNRLHDRIIYKYMSNKSWKVLRLAP